MHAACRSLYDSLWLPTRHPWKCTPQTLTVWHPPPVAAASMLARTHAGTAHHNGTRAVGAAAARERRVRGELAALCQGRGASAARRCPAQHAQQHRAASQPARGRGSGRGSGRGRGSACLVKSSITVCLHDVRVPTPTKHNALIPSSQHSRSPQHEDDGIQRGAACGRQQRHAPPCAAAARQRLCHQQPQACSVRAHERAQRHQRPRARLRSHQGQRGHAHQPLNAKAKAKLRLCRAAAAAAAIGSKRVAQHAWLHAWEQQTSVCHVTTMRPLTCATRQ